MTSKEGEMSQIPQSAWQNPEFELKTREMQSGAPIREWPFLSLAVIFFEDVPV